MRRGAAGGESTLGGRATSALGWSLLNTAVGRFGTLAIGIVLARLLGPTEFGTFAVATVALLAILSFNDLGISLAVVRWDDAPRRIAPTVNSLSVASSLLLTTLVWLLAAPYAAAMGSPAATWPVRWLAVSILINGLVATPAAVMQRELMQRQRMVVDQVNVWSGAIVSVALAVLGWGAMSLAIGRLCGSTLSAILFLRMSPIPYRFGFDRAIARRLMRFGLPLAGASAIVFVTGYLDQIVVGVLLGPQQLGFYVLAVNLASWPVSLFSQPMRSVTPALLARIRHDPAVTDDAISAMGGLLASVAAPVCLILAAVAEPFIRVVYGPAWAPGAPILWWLALFALVRIAAEFCYDVLVVLGATSRLLVVQAIWVVALIPALLAGAVSKGAPGVGLALLAAGSLIALPLYVWSLLQRGTSAHAVTSGLAVPLAVATTGAAVSAIVVRVAPGDVVALSATALTGALMAAALHKRVRRLWRELATIRSTSPENQQPGPGTHPELHPNRNSAQSTERLVSPRGHRRMD